MRADDRSWALAPSFARISTIDNVFIERLWRSVKYEDVYLHAYASGSEVRRSLTRYFSFYNGRRVHESLGYTTPDEVYFGALSATTRAAA
jgi:putative transposase